MSFLNPVTDVKSAVGIFTGGNNNSNQGGIGNLSTPLGSISLINSSQEQAVQGFFMCVFGIAILGGSLYLFLKQTEAGRQVLTAVKSVTDKITDKIQEGAEIAGTVALA